MNRRTFLGSAMASVAAAEAAKPNFLFVICDDLTYRSIHALNNPEVSTPNLDRLVNEGCAFTHCFHQGSWSGAVCVPSRTMLNTGLSAFQAQAGANNVPSWGQTLRDVGYETYIVGKWHLDPNMLKRSFVEQGPVSSGMLMSTPDATDRPKPGNHWDPSDHSLAGHWLHTGEWLKRTPDEIEHSSEVWTDCAIEYLQRKRTTPFFMYVGYNAPHDPRQAPKEFIDQYPREKIQLPPNYLPQHPFDQGDRLVRDEVLAPFPRTEEAVRVHRQEYYAILTHLDGQIGRLLDSLDQSGKARETYVILTADHGIAIGQHGLMGKQNLYDHSIRMPLLVRGPGVKPGTRVDSLVYQHSVFPTTCELAGVPIPKHVQFPSLAPMLSGSQAAGADSIFTYYRDFQRAVRTKTHKLIVYPQAKRVQLFDVAKDPWEIHDISGDPAQQALKTRLTQRLQAWQRELGDKLELAHEAIPSARQLRWHAMEMYAFLHFTVNTFTNREWGLGDEDPSVFNPTAFDADAIVAGLKAGGMKGVILTCKHHDGFCLWPTKSTEHCVRKSSWRAGQGDVVREISDAARRAGLKFGVYLSPWDRNSALYGKPEYIQLYRQQLTELLTGYGEIFEVWFDGANGGDGYYGGAREKRLIDKSSYYDWQNTWDLVRRLQPDAAIFSDVGPDVRWVGNERGVANETCWATYDPVGLNGKPPVPGQVRDKDGQTGTRNGKQWMPPECDVSIRPGWFWHGEEDARVKTPRALMDLYYQSVGRGGNLLLNVPPDRRGLLGDADLAALRGFGSMLRGTFGENLASGAKVKHSGERITEYSFAREVAFDVVRLRENLALGQRVDAFELDFLRDGNWVAFAKATSIGACRLIRLPQMVQTRSVRLRITEAAAKPELSSFALFQEKAS